MKRHLLIIPLKMLCKNRRSQIFIPVSDNNDIYIAQLFTYLALMKLSSETPGNNSCLAKILNQSQIFQTLSSNNDNIWSGTRVDILISSECEVACNWHVSVVQDYSYLHIRNKEFPWGKSLHHPISVLFNLQPSPKLKYQIPTVWETYNNLQQSESAWG